MYYSNTAINLMQAPILTVSPSLMQWMILLIDLYKLVCYTDIHHFPYTCMHTYIQQTQ